MLNRLVLENFKAWQKLNISFGKVTGLFGTNSSGKSSLLQFLLMLKQTKNATDRGLVLDLGGPGQLVNLGTYRDMVYGHDEDKSMSWGLNWSPQDEVEIIDPVGKRRDVLFRGDNLWIESKVVIRKNTMTTRSLRYTLSDQWFSLEPKSENDTEFKLTSNSFAGNEYKFIRTTGRAWAVPGPVKTYLFPDQAKTYYQNVDFLRTFEFEYETLMDKIYYLGPLREHPKREYQWGGASPMDVGTRGERTIDAVLAATNQGEMRNLGGRTHYKPFQEIIAYWLKKLGLIHEFRIEQIAPRSNLYQARVKRDTKGPEALLTDVGFGVSQVLPALVLLYYVPEYSTVLMEQPEIHLHPSVQSGLADVIMKVAHTRNVQVIVESHSEHFLRRLQRLVAENKYDVDMVKLYFCDNKNGQSDLQNLKLNLFGEIENWPDNFFGDELGEIAAIKTASLKRKQKQRASQ